MTDENTVQLGGNIELSGFSEIDGGKMVVLKKIIGNYANKLGNKTEKLEKLSVSMKKVHENQFEVKAHVVDNGKQFDAENTDRNLFIAVDNVLKKIMNAMGKV